MHVTMLAVFQQVPTVLAERAFSMKSFLTLQIDVSFSVLL
jgi:hypothetical protein